MAGETPVLLGGILDYETKPDVPRARVLFDEHDGQLGERLGAVEKTASRDRHGPALFFRQLEPLGEIAGDILETGRELRRAADFAAASRRVFRRPFAPRDGTVPRGAKLFLPWQSHRGAEQPGKSFAEFARVVPTHRVDGQPA